MPTMVVDNRPRNIKGLENPGYLDCLICLALARPVLHHGLIRPGRDKNEVHSRQRGRGEKGDGHSSY